MAQFVTLKPNELKALREIDECLVSYNIEMTEVTGGTFWKAYTEAQVDGTEEFPVIKDWTNMGNLQQWYDPIDTTNPRLIKLAKELGTAWIRVSGTWANKTYYDFDGKCGGKVPEGFQNVLTKEQWLNLLDFVKAVDGKLLVSIANCPGIHAAEEPMPFKQAELLFKTSKEYGVPISAAEFTNEPNLIALSGLPQGYTAADHARDHDLFGAWLKENYPECLFVGPCTVGDGYQQLTIHSLHKVQQMKPLLLGQHILEALGHFAVILVLEVIVGLISPSAGNANPTTAQFLRQLNEAGIGGVDGVIPLLEITHVAPILNDGEFLSAVHLRLCIGLPKRTACHFRHLNIIGSEAGIHLTEFFQRLSLQFHMLSHLCALLCFLMMYLL